MGPRVTTQRRAKSTPAKLWGNLPHGATVVVDTAPIIYVLEGNPRFCDQFTGLFEAAQAGHLNLAISTITLAEVLTGPFKAGQTALAKRFENALSRHTLLAVTPSVAVLAAQLRAQYGLRLPDAIQLATALDSGATAFVTHDRAFSHVTGIDILTGP
jgi:predicted nucleic acid-binding protein